jgi:hypothetical protein
VNDECLPDGNVIEPDTAITLTVDQRVANGWRWLEQNFPGWQDRIERDTLDLAGVYNCICGQVFAEATAANPRACGRGTAPSGYALAHKTLFSEANGWITDLVDQDPAEPVVISDTGELTGWTEAHDRRAVAVAVCLGFLPDDRLDGHTDPRLAAHDHLQAEWQRWLDDYDVGRAIARGARGRPAHHAHRLPIS